MQLPIPKRSLSVRRICQVPKLLPSHAIDFLARVTFSKESTNEGWEYEDENNGQLDLEKFLLLVRSAWPLPENSLSCI